MSVYIPVNINDLQGIDGILDGEDVSAAGEGAQVYIRSEDIPLHLNSFNLSPDAASISGSGTLIYSNIGKAKAQENNDPNYIPNRNENTPPPPPPPPPPPGSSDEVDSSPPPPPDSDTSEIDQKFKEYEEKLAQLENDIDPDDYFYIDENGYKQVDAEKVEDLFRQVILYAYILEMLAMIGDALVNRAVNAVKIQFGKNVSGSQSASQIGQILDTKVGNFNTFINQLFSTALESMQSKYQKEYDDADKHNDSTGERLWDYLSGGENSKEVYRAKIEAGDKFEKALQKLIAAMKQVMTSMTPQTKEAAGKLDGLIVKSGNGYIDVNTQGLLDLRKTISNELDIQQAYMEAALAEIDRLSIATQVHTGIKTQSGRSLLLKITAQAKSHVLSVFDQTANLMLVRKQVYNQINYDKLQLKKIEDTQGWNIVSSVLLVVALIASVVASFVTFGGAAFIAAFIVGVVSGLMSAAARFGAAKWANDNIHDEFTPLQDFDYAADMIRQFDEDSSDQIISALAGMEKKERPLFRNFDKGMLVTSSDGFRAIDPQAFFKVADQLENIQAIKDALLEIYMALSERALIAAKISVGFDTGSGMRQVVDSASESGESSKDLTLQAINYRIGDMKMAWNNERTQEIAMVNATRSFLMNSGFSVLGGFAAAGIGQSFHFFSIGYGIMGAIGGATAEVVNAHTSVDASYEKDKEFIELIKQSTATDEYERMQNQYLIQLLEDTKVDIGKGRKDISSAKLVEIQKALGMLETIKGLKIEIETARAYVVRDLVLSDAGVSATGSRLGDKISTRSSKTLSSKLSYTLNAVRESIEVGNRAARAHEALDQAWTNFGISAGVATVMAGTGGVLAGGHFAGSAGMTILNLTTPAMSLLNGLYNIFYYMRLSKADYGDLMSDYDRAKMDRDRQIKRSGLTATDKLDALESDIMLEAGKQLLSEYGMNSGFSSNFNTRISRLYQLKELIDRLLEAETDRLAMAVETYGGKISLLSSAERNNQTIAFAAIENVLTSLRAMSQRRVEMDQAELMMWKNVVGTTLAAAEFGLSIMKSKSSESILELDGVRPDPRGTDDEQQLAALYEKADFWMPIQISINSIKILNSFSGTLTTLIYRKVSEEDIGQKPTQVKEPAKGEKGIGAAINKLETDSINVQVSAGDSALDREATFERADLADEIIGNSRSFFENGVSITGAWKKQSDEKAERETYAGTGFGQENGAGTSPNKPNQPGQAVPAAVPIGISPPKDKDKVSSIEKEQAVYAAYLDRIGGPTKASVT